MTSRQTGRTLYAIALVVLAVTLVAAAVRAQSPAFYAKRTEIQRQAAADREQAQLSGNANQKKLFTLHPTPEIPLAKPVAMAAGSTAPLSIVGKFSDKTTFVSASDGVELTNPVVAANSFKATLSAAAGLPPGWGRIYAFAPVSGAEAWTPAVFIGAPPTFNLNAKNGWTIKLAPQTPAFAFPEPGTATVVYKAEFYKPETTTPFETTTGSLTIEAEGSVGAYTFMMSAGGSGAAMAEVLQLGEKMGVLMKAGKFGGPELTALQKKLEAAQDRYTKETDAQMKDPAAFQKKQDDFGCGTLNLFISKGQISGNVNCGKNVGSSLSFTGK
jgi:hypothetical protein